ncbi:344_t:CDS:2, partial [Entrophospora sp. SA101]
MAQRNRQRYSKKQAGIIEIESQKILDACKGDKILSKHVSEWYHPPKYSYRSLTPNPDDDYLLSIFFWRPEKFYHHYVPIIPSFPFYMLSKSGFTLELVSEILSLIPDIGLDKVVQRIRENHIDYYLKKENRYYEHCIKYQNYLSASNNSDFFGMNISMNNYVFKIFSKFDDPDEYQGLCPSATVIRECFLNYFETKLESFIDMYMRNLSGEVLSSDHTFKVASLVWIAKNQPFGAFWAVLNEYNEVITMAFVKDKSNACIKPILENLKKRYQLLNKDDPWACMGRESQSNLFYKQFVRELRDIFFINKDNQKKIPQPTLLEERLENFIDKYKNPKFNIINENFLKQHRDNLIHIRLGCVSDVQDKPSEIIIKANKAFATPFRRTACGPRMANALLKINVYQINVRMGRVNRQDNFLLKCNYSYLIKTKLRTFELMKILFPTEHYDEFLIYNINSNETFGFLSSDKDNLLINDTMEEELNDMDIMESGEDMVSSLLDLSYDSSDPERTGGYVCTSNFNSNEHSKFKELYKNHLNQINDPKNINWDKVYEYWMDLADRNADSNSCTLIRPKLKEHLKEHFSVINNFYLQKKIEESVEAGSSSTTSNSSLNTNVLNNNKRPISPVPSSPFMQQQQKRTYKEPICHRCGKSKSKDKKEHPLKRYCPD